MSVCVTSHVSVPRVRECLWDPSAALPLVDPAKGKAAAASLSLGPWAPSWAPAAGQEGPGLGLLEETTTSNTA